MPSLVNHGIPVVTTRQWVTGLSPNAAGDGWNYIVQGWLGPTPSEWVVIKELTDVPIPHSENLQSKPTHLYGNIRYQISTANGQLRALNGRIFFLLFGNYMAYYDPTTEDITVIGPYIEAPPIDPNASTIPYSATFDTAGKLYTATQESHNRPSCVVETDPDTLTQTVLGYVGSGSAAYTTYGYYIAADTNTANRYIYVVYGQNPWQLWALNIDTGLASKLEEVSATGRIQFTNISGQGWIATVNTDVGHPDDIVTQWWCLDGNVYPYTVGVPPPLPTRNVTPASNPLINAPSLDVSGGIGVVGWRPHGSIGAYTYLNYTINYASPVPSESLVDTSDGVLGNALQYQGLFRYTEPADSHIWYGVLGDQNQVSEGPRLRINDDIYIAGYPNGVLLDYNESQAYQVNINPKNLGYYGAGGIKSGIKYARFLAWSPGGGASGRLYCLGERERSGVGSGIGYWDHTNKLFGGTFAGLDTVLPAGMANIESLSEIVISTKLLTPPGTAQLIIFDRNCVELNRQTVIAGLTNLGTIWETSTPGVILGIIQGSGNSLGLYQFNLNTNTLVTHIEIGIVGTLGLATRQLSGDVFQVMGNNLVQINPDTLSASIVVDISSITPIVAMSFAGDGHTIFFGGGSASSEIWSYNIGGALIAESGSFFGTGHGATFLTNGGSSISAGFGVFEGSGYPAALIETEVPSSIPPGPSSSVGLVWFKTSDPTISPGVSAPKNQLLIRTDNPNLYYKDGDRNEDWVLIGDGTSANASTDGVTLSGDGSPILPISIQAIQHDSTLSGNGTSAVPLIVNFPPGAIVSLINDNAGSLVICTPVYSSGSGHIDKTRANTGPSSILAGIVAQASVAHGDSGDVQVNGPFTATTVQWDFVTGGSGGLVFDAFYYIDPSTAGKLTSVAPSTNGQYSAPIGRALSTTVLNILPYTPILI